MASSRDGFVEVVACNADDIKDGEMKEVEVEGKKLLIVRTNGSFHAVSPKCTHYGAPLSKGALCNGRIRCPWHGACFDVRTGDIEDFPGIDNLQTFQVTVVGNQVKVRVKRSEMKTDKRALVVFKKINKDKRVFLIIGGGGAGMMCAVTLRQQGFQGTIIIATKEKHLPYDRPKLSKDLKATPDNLCLRSKMDYASSDIQIQTGKEVQEINFTKKFVTFKDGKNTTYDSVLVATGGSPNTLDIPGKNLRNIFVLRSVDDGNLISSSIRETTKVVIIGSSFIGLEVAAYLAGKVASVTVVGRGNVPLSAVLGKDVGLVFQKILESKGVNFIFNNGPKEFLGKDEKLCGVVLEDGANIDADVCVLGVGVRPTTDFLKDSGIEMSPDNYILVNESMQTNIKDVYAAGDIVRFPLFLSDDKHVNIQHWQMANQHGRIAGMNMAGKSTEIHSVPFFWTMIAGKSLRYAGYGHGYTDIVLHGDPGSEKFVSFYIKDEQVVAAASMNFDPIVAQFAEMLHNRKRITKAEVVSNPTDFWTLHR